MSSWSEGTFCGVILRQDWSFAGYANAPAIRQSFIQPFFNLNLPAQWFINSSPEMIYNWESHRWFIPFDLMLGKMLTKSLVISLELESAIVNAYPQYQTQLEFRLGAFF